MTKMFSANLGPHPQFPKSVKPGIPKLGVLKPGWRRVTIGNLFTVMNRPVDMKDNEKYTLVTVRRARGGVVKREELPGRKIAVKSQFYVETGDFLISKRQIVHGACGFVPVELNGSIVSNEYAVLKCTDIVHPQFLQYLMHTPYFQQTCFHSSIGVHVEKMIFKLSTWFSWHIDVPSLSEQKKMADFLHLIDRKSEKLLKKRRVLEKYKLGVISKIFSRELNFKQDNGSGFPGWGKLTLSELADRCTLKNSDGIDRVLTNSAIEGIVSQRDYFEKNIANANNLDGYYVVEEGDYVYNPRISASAPVGPVNKNKIGVGLMSPLYTIFRFKSNGDRFFEKYFQSHFWHRYMRSVANYGVRHDRMNITISDFMAMPVPAPHVDEQRKIVAFLDAIDSKIETTSKQTSSVENFKKGLLQKMFV